MSSRPSGPPRGKDGRFKSYLPGGYEKQVYGPEWTAFRNEQLARADRCERCGRRAEDGWALEVHHRWPTKRGGPIVPADPDCPVTGVQILCKQCHYRYRQPPQVLEWYDLLDELYPPQGG